MANIRRYDPFSEMVSLRDAMSQLFEDSFVSAANGGRSTQLSMPLNVSETQDNYLVEAAVPGLKPEDLEITLQDNVLTIRGETRQEQQAGNGQGSYHILERRYGKFGRSVTLPAAVNPDAVQATLEHGILRVEVPKAEERKPRKIAVNAGTAEQSQSVDVTQTAEQSQARGQ